MTDPARRPPTRAATRMGVATLASRCVGFVRVWTIAAVLGTTYLGNAFQASNAIPNVLFELLAAGALSAVLVPPFVEALSEDEDEASRLAGGLLGIALLVLGVVTVVGVLAAPLFARLLASNIPNERLADNQEELITFLLRFFVPQVLFYAYGTIATALLFAKRRFVAPALAPVANTVVLMTSLIVFRVLHGDGHGLRLDLAEKLVLALGGTLGVVAFVSVPAIALARTGVRLRARLDLADPKLRRLLGLSTWAVLPHAAGGLLLGTSIVMGNRVAGGVVAFQFALVCFLAPAAIFGLPVGTTILPDLAADATRGDLAAFAVKVRWALDTIAQWILPVTAGFLALAQPLMQAVTIGTGDAGVQRLAAALASLGIGLYGYCVFQLFSRAYYAFGNSRLPALVSFATALVGGVVMVMGVTVLDGGSPRVFALGVGYSVAYLLGAAVLGVALARRLGTSLWSVRLAKLAALATAVGLGAWGAQRVIDPQGRLSTAVVVAVVGIAAASLYFVGLRRMAASEWVPTGPSTGEPDLAIEP